MARPEEGKAAADPPRRDRIVVKKSQIKPGRMKKHLWPPRKHKHSQFINHLPSIKEIEQLERPPSPHLRTLAAPSPNRLLEKSSYDNSHRMAAQEARGGEQFVRPPLAREYSRKKKLQEREQMFRER